MKNINKLTKSLFVALLFAGMLSFVGCGGGVSEEQMAQLEELRAEVGKLSKDINSLKNERTNLQRSIASKKAELEKCKEMQEKVNQNLNQIKK